MMNDKEYDIITKNKSVHIIERYIHRTGKILMFGYSNDIKNFGDKIFECFTTSEFERYLNTIDK